MSGITEASIETTARLHLGFLDMNFGLGRRFGSLGLSLDAPKTRVRLSRTPLPDAIKCARAAALLKRLDTDGGGDDLYYSVDEAIPGHSGLGSGTQLALAVGAAFEALHGRTTDARVIAAKLDRGARSGIGIGAFDRGGFLLDGGRGATGAPAPIIARLPFPDDWSVLLAFDDTSAGVHGDEERDAFAAMPAVAPEIAGRFCRLALMQILPALAEHDFPAFSAGIRALQDGMGALFAPYQGGNAFQSSRVRDVLAWLDGLGINGSGQSSWGPTGFAFIENHTAADVLIWAKARYKSEHGLRFDTVRGLNRGALVTVR